MSGLASLCVGARSAQPCTAQCSFQVEDLPHLVFSAAAVEGGTVLIQQGPSGLHQLDPAPAPVEQHQPYWLHYLGSGAPQHNHQQPSSSTGQHSMVLIINDTGAHGEEPIWQLVWGGGPYHLLAAASSRSVSIISLLPFMSSLKAAQEAAMRAGHQQQAHPLQLHTQQPVGTKPPQQTPAQQHGGSSSSRKRQRVCCHPSMGYVALPAYYLSAQLLDLQWTYDATGLLLADMLGNIVMLQLNKAAPQQRQQQQQPQLQPQQQWQVHELWCVRADQPQHLIAAGAWPTGPAATVSADSSQRVIIWWPSPDSKNPGCYGVGAEVIRHPVKAVQLQWSPPLPRSGTAGRGGSSGGAAAAAAAGSATGNNRGSMPGSPVGSPVAGRSAGGLPPLLPAASAGGGADAAAAAAAQQDGSSTGAPAGQPALMTVGVDGIIRVFVEVVLSDIGPRPPAAAGTNGAKAASSPAVSPAGSSSPGPAGGNKAAAAAGPAASMSQFCLTLVIDPPCLGPQKGLGLRPGLTVTWARPLSNPNPQQPQLLWLLASYVAPQPPQEPLPLAAALSGVTPAAAAAAAAAAHGTMHPGVAVLQPPPAAGTALGSSGGSSMCQGPPVYQDQVYLWAVDGLAGVVLSGIAANAITSNQMCEPRAYLWGKDSSTLSWRHPSLLLQQAAATHGLLSAHQANQQQRLHEQLGTSRGASSPSMSIGLSQAGVRFRHSLGAWVVESPAGPLLSVLQHYHAPLLPFADSSWTWHKVNQLLQDSSSRAAAATDAARGLEWPLLGGGVSAAGGGSSGDVGAAVSEVRSYQVTPLTGVNEAGQPSSAIAVAATGSRAAAGSAEEWVQVSVHTAADLAAAVSSSGALAVWSLCPVQILPLAPPPLPAQQQQQRGLALPGSWHSCKTCCWLTFGGAAAAAAASAAGLTGLPLLLAVHGGDGIDICLVTLSHSLSHSAADQPSHHRRQQQQAAQPGFSSSSSNSSRGPCITGVHVLHHLDLPAGVTGVKQLVELGACQVPSPQADTSSQAEQQQTGGQDDTQQQQQEPLILQASLLGLGGYQPSAASGPPHHYHQQNQQSHQEEQQQQQQEQQPHPHHVMQRLLSDADRLDVPGQDAWVSWTLQVCLQPPPPELPSQQSHGPFAAASAAADPQQQQQQVQWPVQLHASRSTVTPVGEAVSPMQAATAAAAAAALGSSSSDPGSSAAAAAAGAGVGAAVTCLQCPSPASPFLVTGNADGMLMLWQAAPARTPAASTQPPPGGAPSQQQQGYALTGAAAGVAAADAGDGSCGPCMQLLQASGCSVGGVNLGGICVAVALCASAGYAAAAITCGLSELEDAVFIWCAEGSTHSASSSSTHRPAAAAGCSSGTSTPQALSPRAAAATAVGTSCGSGSSGGGPFVLDCLLPLEDTAASLAWLDTGGLPPLLAVGVASGVVEVYSRDRSGQWNTLACYEVGLSVNFIAANRLGLPLLVAGSQLLLLSNLAALALPDGSSSGIGTHALQHTPAGGAVSVPVVEAPSAVVAAFAGWDSEVPAPNGTGSQAFAAALSGGSMLAAGDGSHPVSWGLVNLCRQLQPLQPLKVSGGPAAGAWLSGADVVLATHAALAAAAGSSSLPLYHPEVLLLLLGQGRLSAAAHIIRCVLEFVIRHKAGAARDAGAAAVAAAAAAGSSGVGWSGSSSSQGCSVSLEALLAPEAQQGALVSRETVARCCSFRDKVVAAALGGSLPGGSSGGSMLAAGKDTGAGAAGGVGLSSRLGHKPAAEEGGPLKPAVAPVPASAAAVTAGSSALDTGMLDMSAFGDFGGFGGAGAGEDDWGEQPCSGSQQQSQQQAAGPASTAAAAAGGGNSSSNALESGMLDMSAFGGFGGFCEPEDGHHQQQQQHITGADDFATGLLDMSAFGFGGDAGRETAAELQQELLQKSAADSGPHQQAAQGVQSTPAAAQGLPPQLLAKTLVHFPSAPKKALAKPVGIGMPGALAGAAATSTLTQQLLLSRAEVRELHAMLGLPEARKQLAEGHSSSGTRFGGGGSGSSAQAYYSRLLGAAGAANDAGKSGYAGGSSSAGPGSDGITPGAAAAAQLQQHKQQQEGDAEVLALLGLNPSQGRQLCNIAAALSTRTFMGEEGAAADDSDYGSIASSSASGPANAAALAASWAAAGSDSASYNSVNRRWPGLSRSSSSIAAAPAAVSGSIAAALSVLGAPDGGFNAALFQEVDSAGGLFAVSVQAALLQLAAHVAAAPAATASSNQQEREKRFSAAVARLFQPVSVSRNLSTHSTRKGAALLAHYPAMPARHTAAESDAAGGSSSSRAPGVRPPLSPSRQQQRSGGGGAGPGGSSGHLGLRSAAANGLGFGRSGSRSGMAMRSSMSVVSMLSFSSLKAESSMDGGSEAGAAAAAAAAAAAQAGSRSWAAFLGLLPGVTPLLCLWALSSSSQASLLQVLLPLVPDGIEDQLAAAGVGAAAVAAEHAHHHHGSRQGAGGAAGSSFAAGAGQEQQVMSWPKLRALGAGLWLTGPSVLRATAESLAKAQYAVGKDPHEPALMYAALGKKAVLQGLFRSSGNKKVADFLARDFSTPDGRAAASKNAFHLLGQHRHHLAAAFFILSGSHWDAVHVLAHDAADPQLALFVARLLDTAAADADSSSGSGSRATVCLQRRLIDSDLMPLAESDADPAAAALAAWLRGADGAAAVTVLLSRMLAAQLLDGLDPNLGLLGTDSTEPPGADNRSGSAGLGDAAGHHPGTSQPASPSPSGVNGAQSPQPPQQGSEAAAGSRQPPSPSPAVLAQLPLLLHWVMSVGLDQLGGRVVSGGLVTVLHKLALRVARCAEVSGLPVAAAEALALADALGDPCAGGSSSSNGAPTDVLGEVLPLMWHARLAAAVLALQLLPDASSPAAAGSRAGSDGSSSSSSSSVDVAHWQDAVQAAAPLLQQLGLKVDPEAVAVVLARHALALNPVLALPAEPAGSGWCWDLPPLRQQQQSAAASAAADGLRSKGSWGLFGSSNGQAAVAALGSGPDAVLAVCMSRTSSITAPSAIASPTLLSRMGSAVAPAAAAAAAAAGAGKAGSKHGPATAADGRPQLGAVSTGPGWGASAGQQAGVQQVGTSSSGSEGPAGVLGVSWEVARQPGDKLAAVSVCSGAQFSCCLLQQQQAQALTPPHAHHTDGAGGRAAAAVSPTTPRQRMSQPGRSLVRPRPIIFATKASGMCPAELLAPANLLSHWVATHHHNHQQAGSRTPRAQAAAGSQLAQRPVGGGGVAAGGAAQGFQGSSSPRVQQSQQQGSASPRALSPAAPYAASSAGSLSGFMSQVLDQLRWPPDPWVTGEYPTRRMSHGSAAVGHVQTGTVAAHPNRPLFVSGSSTGRIYLWQFGDANCKAAYVPLASTAQVSSPAKRLPPHEAVSTPHWGNPAAVRFSRSGARFGAVGEGGLVGLWRQDFISAVDGMGHAEWVGHCLSRSGTGIAFLGDTGSQVFVSGVGERGGVVVLVDTLAPPNAATAASLLSARGAVPTTLCLVPTSSSGGSGGAGAVLVVGDDAGEVRGYDVRVLDASRPLWSSRQQQQQQQQPAAAGGSNGVTSLSCWDAAWMGGSSVVSVFGGGGSGSSGAGCGLGDLVACGSRDGSIGLLNAQTGAVVQQLSSAHYTERKGLLERVGLGGGSGRAGSGGLDDSSGSVVLRPRPAGAVPAAVSGLQACAEGLVSVGWDGVVRFAPFTQLLDEWSARAGDV